MTYTYARAFGSSWCQMCGNPREGMVPLPPAMRQWIWICDDCKNSMWRNPEKWVVL